jgi:hypothetical protein
VRTQSMISAALMMPRYCFAARTQAYKRYDSARNS